MYDMVGKNKGGYEQRQSNQASPIATLTSLYGVPKSVTDKYRDAHSRDTDTRSPPRLLPAPGGPPASHVHVQRGDAVVWGKHSKVT